jgi:uncharacterized protein YndB with AHSA1/START domain
MTHVPELDLVLERTVDVAASELWLGWTVPERLVRWFTPAPWVTTACRIELRPGGGFEATMRSPEGQEVPNSGCYLEVVPERRLTFTNVLRGGFRPARAPAHPDFPFVATVELEPIAGGTRYRALVRHADAAGRKQHEAMGFHAGWSAALDQLVALVKRGW